MNIREKFGKRIRAIRNEKGMSQEELGFKSGLHRTYISEVERAIRNPTITTIESLAKGLDISIEEVFTGFQT